MPTIDAIYSGGKFVPLDPVTLAENERVRLSVEPAIFGRTERRGIRTPRVSACKTVADLIEFGKTLPPDDGSYQMDEWIDESRRLTGFRMPSEKPA